jgi:hypothetical protein
VHEGRTRQSDLRRDNSSAYYALFHDLAEASAERLVEANTTACQLIAWNRIYRDLDHNEVKKACRKAGQLVAALT